MADSNTSLAPRSTREPTATSPATAGDHHAPRPAEPNDPSTAPNRPTTPARTDAGFPQHRPHPFHSTPLKPSPNPWLIDRETGKARRISLVDDTGMGTRFHQLGLNTFNNIIPGGLPSEDDRRKFTTPDLGEKNMSEHAIGIQLVRIWFHLMSLRSTYSSDVDDILEQYYQVDYTRRRGGPQASGFAHPLPQGEG